MNRNIKTIPSHLFVYFFFPKVSIYFRWHFFPLCPGRDIFSMSFIKLTGDIALNWALHRQQKLSHFRPEASVGWMRTHFALYLLNANWGFSSRESRKRGKGCPG